MSRRSLDKRQRARARAQRRATARQQKRHGASVRTPRSAATPLLREAAEISADLEWYMARTEPRMAERALEGLQAAEAVTIVPRVSEVVTRQGRRVVRSRQLLLRTVFVGVRDIGHLDEIAAGAGIATIVSYPVEVETDGNIGGVENRPARLDPVLLQRFVTALAENEVVQPFGIKEGDPVIVLSGPFANFPAVVEKLQPNDRVKIGISMFGKVVPAHVEITQVKAIAA